MVITTLTYVTLPTVMRYVDFRINPNFKCENEAERFREGVCFGASSVKMQTDHSRYTITSSAHRRTKRHTK